MPLEAYEIQAAANALDRVKSIDETIRSLGERIGERAQDCGEAVRNVFGRNTFSHFRNEHLGQITFCAIVNALLQRRGAIIAEHAETVVFPPAPCPEQVVEDPDG